MHIICLDLEGVLVPEIWIAFSKATGISELKITTRDEPDYDKLMKFRIGILAQHKLTLADIQKVIGGMEPLDGAKQFIGALRAMTQVIILSDTFTQFAKPLMAKLEYPTLFCNDLIIDDSGAITGYRLRQQDGKRKAVEALKGLNMKIFASGDSYNDLGMITVADSGALFKAPDSIKKEYPEVPIYETYDGLLSCITKFVEA